MTADSKSSLRDRASRYVGPLFTVAFTAVITLTAVFLAGCEDLGYLKWGGVAVIAHWSMERHRGLGYSRQGPMGEFRLWPVALFTMLAPTIWLSGLSPVFAVTGFVGVSMFVGVLVCSAAMLLPQLDARSEPLGKQFQVAGGLAVALTCLLLATGPRFMPLVLSLLIMPAVVLLGLWVHAFEVRKSESQKLQRAVTDRDQKYEAQFTNRIKELRKQYDVAAPTAPRARPTDVLRKLDLGDKPPPTED